MNNTLREFVREAIKEAAITVAAATSDGLALWVNRDAGGIDVTLYDPNVLESGLEEGLPRVDACMMAIKGTVSLRKARGKCYGAWEINSAAADDKFGPLMYDIARSVVPTHIIISDRDIVSREARSIWSFYLHNRKDVKKLPLDDENDPKTPPPEDDCQVFTPDMVHGKDMNPLNYAIGGKGPSVTTLRAKHKETVEKLSKFLGDKYRADQTFNGASMHFFTGKMTANGVSEFEMSDR